ncbi:hypothetical protein FNX48_003825, partial [Streptomyces sp. IF17]|nr:hypothetical protein [Streptomyces alkaliphilus]
MRAADRALGWEGAARLSAGDPHGYGRRRLTMALVLLMCMVMSVTVLSAQAWAIPGDGMSRAKVELPDLPESEVIEPDLSAETALTTADEIPAEEYVPTATTPWTGGTAGVDLTGLAPGESVPVGTLPLELGVPADATEAEAAGLAGTWTVELAGPDVSHEAGLAGLLMAVTPPAEADPAAEVAVAVDATDFADLYGPESADRFGLTLLPSCVMQSPTDPDCATDPEEVTTLSRTPEALNAVAPATAGEDADGASAFSAVAPAADADGTGATHTRIGADVRAAMFRVTTLSPFHDVTPLVERASYRVTTTVPVHELRGDEAPATPADDSAPDEPGTPGASDAPG